MNVVLGVIGMAHAWVVVLIVAMVLMYLYSGLETGLYVINKFRLELRAESGYGPARTVRKLLHDPRNFLVVLLIGSTIADYVATFATGALFVMAGYQDHAEWYTFLVLTPILFVFCESVPKNIAQRASDTFVFRWHWLLGASNMLFTACGLAPLVRGGARWIQRVAGRRGRRLEPIRHEALAAIVAEGHASGVLTHSQSVMAQRVMRLGELTLPDVLIPMAKVATAPIGVNRSGMMELLKAHNYSRFPLLGPDAQVQAVLDIFTALVSGTELPPPDALAVPLILPEHASITEGLYRLRQGRSPMAVVADTAGRHVGIVTVKDLVEEIVGELDVL